MVAGETESFPKAVVTALRMVRLVSNVTFGMLLGVPGILEGRLCRDLSVVDWKRLLEVVVRARVCDQTVPVLPCVKWIMHVFTRALFHANAGAIWP